MNTPGIYYMPWEGEGKKLKFKSKPFFSYMLDKNGKCFLFGRFKTARDAERAIDKYDRDNN